MFSWLCFQMNMDNYPHVTIAADGSLCSTGQHRPGIPRVLYDALRQLGYDGDAPVYRGRMSMAHGQDKCEVNVVIPLSPMEPWMATLQASTGRTIMRQHLHSSSLEQHVEELRRANAILRSGMPPPSDQDREL
jgi:hypothetical protein